MVLEEKYMKPAAITAVISFCTNDFRFIKACIEGVRPIASHIVIPVCDHFFDGTEENYALLEHVYRSFPDCQFIEYAFDPEVSYRFFSPLYPDHPNWRHEWHNTSRWIAYHFLPSCDYVLFLDCDEIIDHEPFTAWWNQVDARAYAAISCASHWHFREAKYEAQTKAPLCMLFNRQAIKEGILWDEAERAGIFMRVQGDKLESVQSDHPFVRHYSWVRTQEELKKKFRSWGHHWERPWSELVSKEFSHTFSGVDFIRRYHYETVEPSFDPLTVPIPTHSPVSLAEHRLRQFPNLLRVDRKIMRRKEVEALCLT